MGGRLRRGLDCKGAGGNFLGTFWGDETVASFFFFWSHCTARGILVPWPGIEPLGIEPESPALEDRTLTTGPPGNFQKCCLLTRVVAEWMYTFAETHWTVNWNGCVFYCMHIMPQWNNRCQPLSQRVKNKVQVRWLFRVDALMTAERLDWSPAQSKCASNW